MSQEAENGSLICGVDEAGRGPIAGPVYAGAVILPPVYDLPGLGDSKKLTEKQREALFTAIQQQALAWGIGRATAAEIDTLNILNATKLAMRRAVDALAIPPDELWIDGNFVIQGAIPAKAFIKGDALYPCISAASILAKVARDRYMQELDKHYPDYGFAGHKGYGTEAHALAMELHGLCPEHREKFAQTLLERRKAPTEKKPTSGQTGEVLAAQFLEAHGFRILGRNVHSPYGEIDIIAEDGETLVFAEVKARKKNTLVTGAEAVTPAKQRKLTQTAQLWLAENPTFLQPRFDVFDITLGTRPEIRHIPGAFDAYTAF